MSKNKLRKNMAINYHTIDFRATVLKMSNDTPHTRKSFAGCLIHAHYSYSIFFDFNKNRSSYIIGYAHH